MRYRSWRPTDDVDDSASDEDHGEPRVLPHFVPDVSFDNVESDEEESSDNVLSVEKSPPWMGECDVADKLLLFDNEVPITPDFCHKDFLFDEIIRQGPAPENILEFANEDLRCLGSRWEDAAWVVIESFFKEKKLVHQQLDSFNAFMTVDLYSIIVDSPPIVIQRTQDWSDRVVTSPSKIVYQFENVSLTKPSIWEKNSALTFINPNDARLRNLSYSTSLYVNIHETITKPGSKIEKHVHRNVFLGMIPLMVRSTYCALNNITDPELLGAMGECALDPGGYFIVNGCEKVIVAQERTAQNQIYVFPVTKSKYSYKAEIRSVAENWIGGASPLWVNLLSRNRLILGKQGSGCPIVAILQYVKQDIPLAVLFRALGCISDREIMEHISLDLEDFELLEMVKPSIDEGFAIQDQEVALNFIGSRALKPGVIRQERINHAKRLLEENFLPHIGREAHSSRKKVFFLGYMVNRLLSTALGRTDFSDRDHYGNKRLDLVGPLFANLFRQVFYKCRKDIRAYIQNRLDRNQTWDVNLAIRSRTITDGLRYSLGTGNWGEAKKQLVNRSGVSQVLNRLSYLATLSQLRRLTTPINRDASVTRVRQLHNTHWGILCPAETPEGQSVGLIKSLALMACVSVRVEADPVLEFLDNHGVEVLADLLPEAVGLGTKVFVNGNWMGIHRNADDLVKVLKELRTEGRIFEPEISIVRDVRMREVRILTDAGRVYRPLLIVDEKRGDQTLALKRRHLSLMIDKENNGTFGWPQLLASGAVEYIDVNEEENIVCAMFPDELNRSGRLYTHCEIHPSMVLGVCASVIPFPDHNQSPRNTYQAGMAKQSLGVYSTNYEKRFDSTSHIMYYPQKALVSTKAMNLLRSEVVPSGANCIVAVASYTGYNQEDSVILNAASIQRGLLKHTFYRTYEAAEELYLRGRELQRIEVPNPEVCEGMRPSMYSKLDSDGIVRPGERVSATDCLIGKVIEYRKRDGDDVPQEEQGVSFKDASVFMTTSETGIVDEVLRSTTADGRNFCKVRVRSVRTPVMGDKFASRHGQKGTVGFVFPAEDLPFTKEGIVPDIVINPHAIPSRMTIGHLIECLTGKVCAIEGKVEGGTPFSKLFDFPDIRRRLASHNYNLDGNEVMYNGFSGSKINSPIFIGPTYYQRLKHMVDDKMYSRSRGAVTTLLRQPQAGRSRGGGLRVGEMERDCLISHGAALNLRERLFEVSDAYRVHVCSSCGYIAVVNLHTQQLDCRVCVRRTTICQVTLPYACKLLFQEMMSMGISPRMLTE